MKKKCFLSIILSLVLLAVPVMADAPYRLAIDGVYIDESVVIIDDKAYVPIRAVADTFNAKTEWLENSNTVWVTTHAKVERPPIEGDAEFVKKINEALDLLEEKDYPHYVMVCEYTFDIMQLKKVPPALPENALAFNMFGATRILPYLMNDAERYTPTHLAGVLVHEACHATTNKYDKPGTEKDAYAHELAVFEILNAPQWMKNECKNRE